MKFARLGEIGSEIPVVIDGASTFDLRPLTSDVDGAFLASDPVPRVAEALAAGTLPELADADELRIGAPIVRPSAVVCIGMNYAAHAAESGSEPPSIPIMFLKTPNTVVGPNDTVEIPRGSEKTGAGLRWWVASPSCKPWPTTMTAAFGWSSAAIRAAIARYAPRSPSSERPDSQRRSINRAGGRAVGP